LFCLWLLAQTNPTPLFPTLGFISEALLLPGVVKVILELLRRDQYPILTLHALLAMEMFSRTGL
jgi:hypothetical protein